MIVFLPVLNISFLLVCGVSQLLVLPTAVFVLRALPKILDPGRITLRCRLVFYLVFSLAISLQKPEERSVQFGRDSSAEHGRGVHRHEL